MSDPIRHEDMILRANVREAYRFASIVAHVLEDQPAVPGLVGAAVAFLAVCTDQGVDPSAVLDQVQDAIQTGDLLPEKEDQVEIDGLFLKVQ